MFKCAAKLTEAGRGESDAPPRGEMPADQRLQQGPALIENSAVAGAGAGACPAVVLAAAGVSGVGIVS